MQEIDRICIKRSKKKKKMDLPPSCSTKFSISINKNSYIYSVITETDDRIHDTRKSGNESRLEKGGWTLLAVHARVNTFSKLLKC